MTQPMQQQESTPPIGQKTRSTARGDTGTICRQAGVIVYRMVEGKVQVLLLTSGVTGRFAIPKGNIEEGTSARDIGAKQAFEEGGIGGTFDNDGPLGVFNYHDRDADGSISLMSIEVHVLRADEQKKDSLPKKERPLTWVSPELAAKLVWESGLAKLFLAFAEIKPAL